MIRIAGALVLIFLAFFPISCVNNLDFSQADESELYTPLTLSFVHFDLQNEDFIDENNNVIALLSDEYEIHIKRLISHDTTEEVTLDMRFDNSLNLVFQIGIDLYDENDVLLHTISPFIVPPNTENFNQQIVFAGDDFTSFLNTNKVIFNIGLQYGTPVPTSSTNSLKMQSSISFYYYYLKP